MDIHALIPEKGTTYYEVGKLALNLLSILISKIEALGGLKARKLGTFLQRQPPFCLIKDDPLKSQKVTAAQAIKDFLKV